MKKGIVYTCIHHRQVTIFSVVMFFILGVYSFIIVPKQEYPDTSAPIAMIKVVYPGASPEEMEELVTGKIEEKVMELKGYDYCNSYLFNSVSTTLIVLNMDLDRDEIDKTWDDLRRKMTELRKELPENIQEIHIDTDLLETTGMMLGLSGKNYTYEQLGSYGEILKKRLIKIDGVKRLEIIGEQKKEVKVDVNVEKLNHNKLSLNEMVTILAAQNIQIPSGTIDGENSKINVSPVGMFDSLKEIENIIIDISEDTGAVVRLKDIADISMGLEDSYYRIKQNGKNAILLTGYFKENQNIVHIGKEVRKELDRFKKEIPNDIRVEELIFQPESVARSISDFTMNLMQGIIIVIAVIMLGMGIRNSSIVSFAIPLSIVITFIIMNLIGLKIHMITIAGLIMALGMLVDNAIVVSDAIQVRLDQGEQKMEACVDGAKEVAIPVLSSTLTTVAAFMPLLFLPRAVGQVMEGIPKTIIISLTASYAVAMLVVPVLAYLFFKPGMKQKGYSRIRKLFNGMLALGMRRKVITIIIGIVILIVFMNLANLLPQEMYPSSDMNLINIVVETEYDSDITKTEELVANMEEILAEQKGVMAFTSSIGGGLPKYHFSLFPQANSPDFAQMLLKVSLAQGKFKDNEQLADHLQNIFNRQITGAKVTVSPLEMFPTSAPVQLKVTGDNMELITAAAVEIKEMLRNIKGSRQVEDDLENKKYEFLIKIDEHKAASMGITKYDIQNEINIALMGRKATVFRKNAKEYDIVIRSDIHSKRRLENLAIKSSFTSDKVPLKQIAKIELAPKVSKIIRYDGERAVTISSSVKSGYNAVDIQTLLEQKIKNKQFKGVNVVYEGEKADLENDLGNIGIAAVFAIFFIFIILMVQFNSMIQPFIVLITLPLSVIGSIMALLIFRQPLSLFGFLGVVSLIGVVVNNAIILIDFINGERAKGTSIEEACKGAVEKRFRPVILSTTTTVFGLIPLSFSGNDLFVPMAIAFMGGLMVSTILTLVIIPVIYSLVEGKLEKIKQSFQAANW